MRLVAVGASAGGVDALKHFVTSLPAGFPAGVMVVLHLPERFPSALAQILRASSRVPTKQAVSNERIRPGHIYVAPSNRHLGVEGNRIRLWFGPKENSSRPSIDALFRSVAAHRKAAAGVVLTGMLADGAAGLRAIREAGGLTVVQDPAEASAPDMPLNALKLTRPDFVVPVREIGDVLTRWVDEQVVPAKFHQSPAPPPSDMRERVFSCPQCDGVLIADQKSSERTFTCQVGHVFSLEALSAKQADMTESALWAATRSLAERAQIAERLMHEATARKNPGTARLFRNRRDELNRHADTLRKLIETLVR